MKLTRSIVGPAAAAAVALALSGCASVQPTETAAPPPAPAVKASADQLVGKWGLASYHNDADRARTEKIAGAQCNKPYVIGKGEAGGVMMHLADQPKAQELVIKVSADGKTYIGPAGDPAGGQLDREIVSFDNGVFVTQWVDPDSAARYGTMVYARCAPKAAK